MKFIIALDGHSPIFRQCEEWHTESFDGKHNGLFLDGNCICILKAGQASFLNILKRDESHFSSIEITDDKITIQPIEAESADYERPTGEIDFKENKRMGMTIKEAKRVLKRAGYRIDEMAIERPSAKKERLGKEKAAKDRVLRVFNKILFGEEPDQGIGGSIFGTDFWNMCDKDGFSPEDAIEEIKICATNRSIFRSFRPGNSKDLSDLAEVLANYYLDKKVRSFKFYFYFSEMFIDELLTDEMADYLNFIERWIGNAGYVSKCTVEGSGLMVSFTLPYEENLESFEKDFLNGMGISNAWHELQHGEDIDNLIGEEW